MGKKSKTKLLAKARKEFVDHGCQTDELEKLIIQVGSEDHNNSPTSSIDFQDLTKEQLIIRLRFAQELIQRQQRILNKNEFVKKKQRKIIQDLFHTVKILLIEHRENYSIFKRDITNALTVFANGRKELAEQLDEAKIVLEEDRKQMRDSMSSNNVTVAKAKTAVKIAKNELEELLQQMEKMELKVDKVEKERLFIRQQYDELVNKRNQQVLTEDVLCPKCSATKQCLNEFTDKFTKTKEEKKKFEEEVKQYKKLYEELEKKAKEMENLLKKVSYERDAYKNHFNFEKKNPKKGIVTSNSSPSVDALISNGKVECSSTPKDNGKSSLNGSPVKNQETSSPIIKKVGSLEDGEVISPNEIDGDKRSTKRSLVIPPIENVKKKPKTMDYVYIIEDEPLSVVAPEPKKLTIKTGWPISKPPETYLQVPPMYSDRRSTHHAGYNHNNSRMPSPRLSDPYYRRSPTYQQMIPPGTSEPYAFSKRYQNPANQPVNGLPWHDHSRQPHPPQHHSTQNESWHAWR